jgi:membrane associated rhomboid family serine protease
MNGYGRGLFNILMFLAYYAGMKVFDINLNEILGIYFPKSDNFKPVQILTHMFMHANFMHIFFNMYALFIFGQVLENVWGPKRLLVYYLVCGLGAAFVHESVIAFEYHKLASALSPEQLRTVLTEGTAYFNQGKGFTNITMQNLEILLNIPTIGASGSVNASFPSNTY